MTTVPTKEEAGDPRWSLENPLLATFHAKKIALRDLGGSAISKENLDVENSDAISA